MCVYARCPELVDWGGDMASCNCNHCGREVSPFANTCPNCGEPDPSEDHGSPYEPGKPRLDESYRRITARAAQANAPHIILLQGPGPFQLPRLGSDVNYLALESGAIEIRLETELGQGVRIILPELGAATLRSLLVAEFQRRKAARGE